MVLLRSGYAASAYAGAGVAMSSSSAIDASVAGQHGRGDEQRREGDGRR
jgi:hypothetical protein